MVAAIHKERASDASERRWSGKVALLARPVGTICGIARYVRLLDSGLRGAGVEVVRFAPLAPPLPSAGNRLLQRLGVDVRTFLTTYPVWARYPSADIYHFTSQNLATLLLFRRPPGNVTVTVHDIFPYMLRNDRMLRSYRTVADRFFDRLAIAGLRRADRIIAVSRYTRQCLVEHLGIAPGKIDVVYSGVDQNRFRPLPVPPAIREHYRLPVGKRYLIYVGSEDPRKNLGVLIRALAEVRRELPEVELIKVGSAQFDGERRRLINLATDLDVASAIHFLTDVPDNDLPVLYNVADICVMPSLYEGFGYPVIEAMACGTPVIHADTTALREIGDTTLPGFGVGHGSAARLASLIRDILRDDNLRQNLRRSAREHAANFRIERTAEKTIDTYLAMRFPKESTGGLLWRRSG